MFGLFYFGEQYFAESFPFSFSPPIPPTPSSRTTTYQQLQTPCGYRSCSGVGDFSDYSLQSVNAAQPQEQSECLTRACTISRDVEIYNIQNNNLGDAGSAASCPTRTCSVANEPDVEIYSLQDALFFNGTPLSFLIQCPTGQVCPPGMFPRVFTYPPKTFYFPIPPTGSCSGNVVFQMIGCKGVVNRVVPCGSSPAIINEAAQQVIEEVAQQQAECDSEILFTQTLGLVLSDLPTWACIDTEFSGVITGAVPQSIFVPNPSLWQIRKFEFIGNSQPSWMSAAQSPGGSVLLLSGEPDTFGLVSFAVQATAPPPRAGDPSAVGQKIYTIEIVGINTASPLPDAVPNEQYDQVISATGFGSTPIWGMAYGALPEGLEFNPFFAGSAAITGIPTEEGDFTFAVFVQDGERQCVKEFSISVTEVVASCDMFLGTAWDATQTNLINLFPPFTTASGSASGAVILQTINGFTAPNAGQVFQVGFVPNPDAPILCHITISVVGSYPSGNGMFYFEYGTWLAGVFTGMFSVGEFVPNGNYVYNVTVPVTTPGQLFYIRLNSEVLNEGSLSIVATLGA